MPYTFDSAHGPGVSGASAPVVNSGDKVIQQIGSNGINYGAINAAREIENVRGFDSSEFGDMIREILGEYSSSAEASMNKYLETAKEINEYNSNLSQSFAREQMDYQARSDAMAMAWSAQEAEKNRQYQERLANTAHQREVKDLIAAGLNPILSANAGAYTGSGATGQAFSSSGAMGSVDTSASGILGNIVSGIMNSAGTAASTKMYNEASKYQTDMQYSIAKLNAETSLYMNKSNIEANKAINQLNNDTAIKNADIHSAATLGAASMAAGATQYAANQAAIASMFGSQMNYHKGIQEALINQQTQTDVAKIRNESSPWGLLAEFTNWLMSGSPGNKGTVTGALEEAITGDMHAIYGDLDQYQIDKVGAFLKSQRNYSALNNKAYRKFCEEYGYDD